MSQGPSSARTTQLDPVLAAIENAPVGLPESEEEKRIMAEVRATPGGWISGAEVTAKIEEMKRRDR
jgi:hypothetical protein